jgi:RHS repeat-associated protein
MDADPQSDWHYRYSPSGEREQKRLYWASYAESGEWPLYWCYYLLGGRNEQLAVYHGTESTCESYPTVSMYPTEYLSYSGASSFSTKFDLLAPQGYKEYRIADHLGNTRALIELFPGDTGKITAYYDYKPFGEIIKSSGAAPEPRISFIGKEQDSESELGDLGLRKYDRTLGRFTSIDPLFEKYRTVSPYSYALSNPLTMLDAGGDSVSIILTYPSTTDHTSSGQLGSYFGGVGGHIAINIDGTVYTFNGDGAWHEISYKDYTSWEQQYRGTAEVTLANVDQAKVEAYIKPQLENRQTYDIKTNSCVTQTMQALTAGGVPFKPVNQLSGTVTPLKIFSTASSLAGSKNVQASPGLFNSQFSPIQLLLNKYFPKHEGSIIKTQGDGHSIKEP